MSEAILFHAMKTGHESFYFDPFADLPLASLCNATFLPEREGFTSDSRPLSMFSSHIFFLVKNNVFSLGICLSSTFPDKKGHQILYRVIKLSCQPKRLSQDRGKMENEMDIIFNLL